MSDINIITPPDILHNKNFSVFLLYPSLYVKEQFQEILTKSKSRFNVYMYENPDGQDIDWVLNVHKLSQIVILDLDNFPPFWKKLESYLVSFGNTYYLTKAEEIMYNKISANRIFAVEEIESKLGGKFEI
tara:strand:- start:64 stop:453 length:390 start_codon:yes stop_codon:yes gene_type:complete